MEHNLQWLLGQDLQGSTVGIVGLGNIGQEIVKRLKGFDVSRFIYTGHSRKKAGIYQDVRDFHYTTFTKCYFICVGDELGAHFVSLDELLEQSDFVIVAVPLNNETRGLFNADTFGKMKKNAVFVNIGRGKVVNTDALVTALRTGTIFAAGLDVTDPEPLPPDHELLKLPNAG